MPRGKPKFEFDVDMSYVDVEDMLDALEISYSVSHNNATFLCPFHKEYKPSARMSTETTAWLCNGCGEKGKNAISFFAKIRNINMSEAKRTLEERYGGSLTVAIDDLESEVARNLAGREGAKEERVVPGEEWVGRFHAALFADSVWPEGVPENVLHARAYILDRGFSMATLESWSIGYDWFSNRLTIPVRDADGVLVGFKGRSWEPERHPKYCNTPEAPIFMADLSFKKIGDIEVGDLVMGWAKRETRGRWGRQHQIELGPSRVIDRFTRGPVDVMKITLKSGREIRCTPDHLWLVKKRNDWVFSIPSVGDELAFIVDPYDDDFDVCSHEDAIWLGGLFDGEGSGNHHATVICQCRKHNPDVCKRIENVLDKLHIDWYYDGGAGGVYRIKGGWRSSVRLANLCKPTRRQVLIDRVIGKNFFKEPDEIVKIERDEESLVVSLQTETGNYIAWGYGSKNCVLGDGPNMAPRYDFQTYRKSEIVFGLDRMEPAPERLIVVEGELNVLAMKQHAWENVCAVAGSEFSEMQARLIIERAYGEVVIYFDDNSANVARAQAEGRQGVDAGLQGTAKLVRAIGPYRPVRVVMNAPGDANELDEAVVDDLIADAKPALELQVQGLLPALSTS